MPKIFGDYAKIYDIIYSKKNYRKECLYLDRIFRKYSRIPVRDVLDVACGTGNHAINLAGIGYRVFCQDISSEMLKEAICKCSGFKKVKIIGCFAMQKFCHNQEFDACVAMFSSVDYLLKISQLKKAFENIFSCLKAEGVFTFDFWNADCVVKTFSPYKRRVFTFGKRKVIRISQTKLNRASKIANIDYTCYYFDKGQIKTIIKEKHRMKYHRISSMLRLVESCGFEVAGVFPFMKMGHKVKSLDWNISVVAVK